MVAHKFGSVEDLRTGECWFEPQTLTIVFPRIDDIHCGRIYFSFTAVHCFADGYLEKQPVAWKN